MTLNGIGIILPNTIKLIFDINNPKNIATNTQINVVIKTIDLSINSPHSLYIKITNLKNIKLEKLLNIVTDLSAEAVVSIEDGDTTTAQKHIEMLQSYVDKYMEDESLRQVTESDGDYDEYMKDAYSTTSNKQI